jgi:hypothetical protein
MKGNVVLSDSRAAVVTIQLVSAMVAYASDERHFRDMCAGIWPRSDIYRGGTHLRVLVDGQSNGPSVYVNLV